MTPFQEAARERFCRRVRDVPPAVGRIIETRGSEVPGYREVGYDLRLQLKPLTPGRCPLSISLADTYGQVTLGEALLDYQAYGRWGKSDGMEWVDLMEQDVAAAVEGRVRDVLWLRRGKPVHQVTLVADESGEWTPIHTWGFPFMTRLYDRFPRFYARLEKLYLPYAGE